MLSRRKCLERTFLQAAFRAAHSLSDILKPSIPAAQTPQRVRFCGSLMPARTALEHQRILTELVAQFVDMKSGRHSADCYDTAAARPSSGWLVLILYKVSSHRKPSHWTLQLLARTQ